MERSSQRCTTPIAAFDGGYLNSDRAIEAARSWFGFGPETLGEAQLVLRLDTAPDYYLVTLGDPDRSVAVATVDAKSGEVREAGRAPGNRRHLAITRDRAAELSGLSGIRSIQLVWRASRATRSPLYPAWRVSADRIVYVDQQGGVWEELT
jgi:hypothetical protein